MNFEDVIDKFNLKELTTQELNRGDIGFTRWREGDTGSINCPDDNRKFTFFNKKSGGRLMSVFYPDWQDFDNFDRDGTITQKARKAVLLQDNPNAVVLATRGNHLFVLDVDINMTHVEDNGAIWCRDRHEYIPFNPSKITRIYIPKELKGAYMIYGDKKEWLLYGDGILRDCGGTDIKTSESAYKQLPDGCQFLWFTRENECNTQVCSNKGCIWVQPVEYIFYNHTIDKWTPVEFD